MAGTQRLGCMRSRSRSGGWVVLPGRPRGGRDLNRGHTAGVQGSLTDLTPFAFIGSGAEAESGCDTPAIIRTSTQGTSSVTDQGKASIQVDTRSSRIDLKLPRDSE